jgi:tetratricopeptide (TPR) repeat protein
LGQLEKCKGKNIDAEWLVDAVHDVDRGDREGIRRCWLKSDDPRGLYFAGWLSRKKDRLDCFQRSSDGKFSWAQVELAQYYRYGTGGFFQPDEETFLELLKQAAEQNNNPWALFQLGEYFRRNGEDLDQAGAYFLRAAELGWSPKGLLSIIDRGRLLNTSEAAIWTARSESILFWDVLKHFADSNMNDDLQCYALGWGLYWYMFEAPGWEHTAFAGTCLDFYIDTVELQQRSIFTFLWFWNEVVGVKDVGVMIAKMVWEDRAVFLVKQRDSSGGGAFSFIWGLVGLK